MNILEPAAVIILLVCGLSGLRRGLIRKAAGLVSLILAVILANLFLPTVTDYLRNQTPLYTWITERVEETGGLFLERTLSRATTSPSGSSASDSATGDDSGDIVIFSGVSADRLMLPGLEANCGAGTATFTGNRAGVGEPLLALGGAFLPAGVSLLDYSDIIVIGDAAGERLSDLVNSLTRVQQTRLISELPLPSFVRNLMQTRNNSEDYRRMGVESFGDYLVSFLSGLILNVIAYVAALIIASLVIAAIFAALDLFANLPLIRPVNRLLGLAAGLLEAVVIIWIVMAVCALASGTRPGAAALNMIEESPFLRALYDSNLLLRTAAKVLVQV